MGWALCSVDPEPSGAIGDLEDLGEQRREVGSGCSQDAGLSVVLGEGPSPRDKLPVLGFSF